MTVGSPEGLSANVCPPGVGLGDAVSSDSEWEEGEKEDPLWLEDENVCE